MLAEQALLGSRALRAALCARRDVLDEVKRLPLLPDREHTTASMLADYFEVDTVLLHRVVRRHAGELRSNGYRQLRGGELRDFLTANLPGRRMAGRLLGVFTPQAALVLAMLLADSGVAHAVRLRLLGPLSAPGAVSPATRRAPKPPPQQPQPSGPADGAAQSARQEPRHSRTPKTAVGRLADAVPLRRAGPPRGGTARR
ncbi:hypothetical protein [Streptomyces sp. MUM 178J]|uniref:hypothetical protein n=1 Tax=Streptomyces sp. MUM 178J TaxID=2791991 RepID=UPI001F040CFF|nr:hypothetical protein [Streptomyces sp. MUM 178J]WRQ82436.1 hypothetical protein I3F59_025485 [Streptomyces sp. MUM 178J]